MGNGHEPTDQANAGDLIDAFFNHDMATLAKLAPAERAKQREIRYELYLYVDGIWDAVKAYARAVNHGGDPLADNSGYDLAGDPNYSGVAAMRDLTDHLWSNAQQASAAAGDQMDD